MNNKSNEKGNMVLKAAFAMLAAGLPMQYASANGNAAPNALTQTQGAVVQGHSCISPWQYNHVIQRS